MQRRRLPHATQYERPVPPRGWQEDERGFCEQVNRVFDDIYRRYGRLRVEDLSPAARALLSGFADEREVHGLAEAVSLLTVQLGQAQNAMAAMQAPGWALDSLPVGTWLPVSASAPPSAKWWFAQGQALTQAGQPEAYALFGASLPDARGRTLFALDAGQTAFSTLHKAGGEAAHTLTVDELPPHSHATHQSANGYDVPAGAGQAVSRLGTGYELATQDTGGGAPHNNLPPYLTVRYAIKVWP